MEKALSVSIINLVANADVVVQFVILALAVASFFSWAIIFNKVTKFIILKKCSDSFENIFEGTKMLEEIYNETESDEDHLLAFIFISCIKEWKSNNIKQIILDGREKKSSFKERLINSMQLATNRSMQKIEKGISFLAIIGSSAPFVGLFGTVWGVMHSFQNIAINKTTNLAVVAPGIAEALLATATGLFVAIPAVLFYNIFSTKVNYFSERAGNFSMQLLNLLSKELDR